MARKPLTEEQKAARNAKARAKRAQIRAAANKVNESAATSNGSPTSGPLSPSRPLALAGNVPSFLSNGSPQQELLDENDTSGLNAKQIGSSLATVVNSKPYIRDRIAGSSITQDVQNLGTARPTSSKNKNIYNALNGAPTQTVSALNPAQKITDNFASEAKASSSNKQNMGSSKDGGTKPWWDKMNDTLDDINKDIKSILELLKHMKGSSTGLGAAHKNGSEDDGKSDWLSGLSKMLGVLGAGLGALLAAKFGGVAAQMLGVLDKGFQGFLSKLKGDAPKVANIAEDIAKDAKTTSGLANKISDVKALNGTSKLLALTGEVAEDTSKENLISKAMQSAGKFAKDASSTIAGKASGLANSGLKAIRSGAASALGGTVGKLLKSAGTAARVFGAADVGYHGALSIYDATHGNAKGALAQGAESIGAGLTFFGDKIGKYVPAAGPVGAFAKADIMMGTNALGNLVSGFGENMEARTPAEKAAAQKKMGRSGGVLTGMGVGAAAGAAIGSVVPIVGTALGAAAGAAIGGGAALANQYIGDHGTKGISDAAGNIFNKAKGIAGGVFGGAIGGAAALGASAANGIGAVAAGAGGLMAATGGVLANGARAVGSMGMMGALGIGGAAIGLGGIAAGALGNIFKGHDAEVKSGVQKSAASTSVKQSTNTMHVTAQTLHLNARESTASAAMKAAPVASGGGKGGVNINQTITVNQKIDTVNNASPAELKKAMAKFMQTMAANEARIKGQMEQYTQNIGNQLNNPFNSVVAAIANAGSMGGW